MRVPNTQYTLAGDVNIAFQVVGEGPDLVWAWGLASSIEVVWDEPLYAAFLRRLSEFSRVILYDRRGCGASDREGTTATATLEERMEDVLAVLDAVGSERASIFGVSEGGALAALFAATHPDRTASVILYGTMARFLRDAGHPWGWSDADGLATFYEFVRAGWGTLDGAEGAVPLWAPSMIGDVPFAEWMAKHTRNSVSRSAVLPLMRSLDAYDLVDVFPAVRVPALVLHRRDDVLIPVSHGRWIAEHMSGARYVELAGRDHLPFVGDADEVIGEVEAFLAGSSRTIAGRRRLVTLACIDLVEPTRNLTDDAWRELRAAHDELVRNHLSRFDGREIRRAGTGVLTIFDGPARAIRCALGVLEATARLGLTPRTGLHTGECEVNEEEVTGVAADVAARLVELARPGEILVSATVRDLVAGSGIRFGDPREVELEGLGSRAVLPVLTRGESPEGIRRLAVEQTNLFRRDGEYWTVAYDGQVTTLRDTKGMRDLARLLSSPGHEVHAADLAVERRMNPGGSPGVAFDAGLTSERSYEPVIDDAARSSYRLRLSELEADIEDADARSDGAAGAAARAERDALVDELSRAYGIGGEIRRAPDHIERARKAVTRRIRDAMARIDRAHPTLGRHLAAAVRTGVFCSYVPEQATGWTVELQ